MTDEAPIETISEEEYAQHAAEQEKEMQAFVQSQVSAPAARVMSLFAENDHVETLEQAAEIAFWRSKLCTDEGGDNV